MFVFLLIGFSGEDDYICSKKGSHPAKNCAVIMYNPNKTSALKPPVYGFEISSASQELFLCRYKKPCWKLRLDDSATDKEKLAASLRKAAEWLLKRG